MYFLGIDLGTSSIKVSIVNSETTKTVASAQYPETEADIISLKTGWAEQEPETWWDYTQIAIKKAINLFQGDINTISAIGISYQMHGLVMVDHNQQVIRPSIIWCDSRAVPFGDAAFEKIGKENCLTKLLNSPGNFTAAKLAWVKENEPDNYKKIDKIMLPGDFLAMKMTGKVTVTASGLSEGILWDFQNNELSADVMNVFGFSNAMIPPIVPVFSNHGALLPSIANELGLPANIPISYKAGDQPNNALSLGVLEPGDVAATAGTSGVIYAVTDTVSYDKLSRVNSFAHVNHKWDQQIDRIGVLLCINGTGILNRWIKENIAADTGYAEMNKAASDIPIGSNGLLFLPFGNGAERVLQNKIVGAAMLNLDLNKHTRLHTFRAAQEGIAFSLAYGLEIMTKNGNSPKVIKAGKANMFLSEVFIEALVNTVNVAVELYDTDGAKGAALGAGIGTEFYKQPKDAFEKLTKLADYKPDPNKVIAYQQAYQNWLTNLNNQLN